MLKGRLSYKQRNMFDLLADFEREKGKMPTVSEIVKMTGKSRSTIHDMLHRLDELGMIKVEPYKTRGITMLDTEEVNYDKYYYDSQKHIETTRNFQYRPRKKNQQDRRSIWR